MRITKELDIFLAGVADIVNVDAVRAAAIATIENYRSKDRIATALERRWYDALDVGEPDYGIYSTEEYVAELWACWAIYSSKYLRTISAPKSLDRERSVLEGKSPTSTSIAFAKALRTAGYVKVKTRLWNARPTYWRRAVAAGD